MSNERIEELGEQIAELKSRWPAHSAPPTMFQQLDELEQQLERELEKAAEEEEEEEEESDTKEDGNVGRQVAVETDRWKAQIERKRRKKDRFFGQGWQSPIPPEDRAEFRGLDYYPPDPDLRFEIELREHKDRRATRMAYTKGDERDFVQWGEFRFRICGEECVLQAYKRDSEEEQLFVPFRDTTSGQETYGAGRYLDLDGASNRTADGKWILDFNKAYNPWCVYGENYTCPFVPQENWLAVPVRAGEKNYPKK